MCIVPAKETWSSILPCLNICFSAFTFVAAAAKSLQSCPTLCDPIDSSPSGSAIPGILQARTLEWIAISFSNAWKWKVKVKSLCHVRLFVTPWTAAHQAPLSMGFSRQEHWSGLPFPSPVHESEKWKWSHSVVPNLSDPMGCSPQALPSMGFSRQEYWSGVPLPFPNMLSRLVITFLPRSKLAWFASMLFNHLTYGKNLSRSINLHLHHHFLMAA